MPSGDSVPSPQTPLQPETTSPTLESGDVPAWTYISPWMTEAQSRIAALSQELAAARTALEDRDERIAVLITRAREAEAIVQRLAEVYTLETDQVTLIALVCEAKALLSPRATVTEEERTEPE